MKSLKRNVDLEMILWSTERSLFNKWIHRIVDNPHLFPIYYPTRNFIINLWQYLKWPGHIKYLERDAFYKGIFARATKYFWQLVFLNSVWLLNIFCFPPHRTRAQLFSGFEKGTKIAIACAFLYSLHCLWEENRYILPACENEYQKSKSRTHKIKTSLSHSSYAANPKAYYNLEELFVYRLLCICIRVLVQARNCSKITALHTVMQQQNTWATFLWDEVPPETPSRRISDVLQPQMGIQTTGPG